MAQSPYVFDASRENFAALVQGNSRKGLVLANFWTPKAGPCLVLMPRLVQLAGEYAGRFLLVMVNTDELGKQAHALGVNSVPTVKFILHEQVVHTIHGAESDATIRAALDRFLSSDQDRARQQALALHQAGRTAEAIEALARLAIEQPERIEISADLAKLLTLAGRASEALQLLAGLPLVMRRDAQVAPLLAHLELLAAASGDADGREADSPDRQLILAARALLDDDPAAAMQGLLDLSREHAGFRDDIGRRALLALFEMLGSEHPLTRQFRAALAALQS
jgi:putative thioredoxin